MGINNGLRSSDLVAIKVAQVQDLKPGEVLNIVESMEVYDVLMNEIAQGRVAQIINNANLCEINNFPPLLNCII